MKKKVKILSCVLLSIVLAIGLLLYHYYNKPERTIEKYINGMSNHNINEVSKCIIHDHSKVLEGSLVNFKAEDDLPK